MKSYIILLFLASLLMQNQLQLTTRYSEYFIMSLPDFILVELVQNSA